VDIRAIDRQLIGDRQQAGRPPALLPVLNQRAATHMSGLGGVMRQPTIAVLEAYASKRMSRPPMTIAPPTRKAMKRPHMGRPGRPIAARVDAEAASATRLWKMSKSAPATKGSNPGHLST